MIASVRGQVNPIEAKQRRGGDGKERGGGGRREGEGKGERGRWKEKRGEGKGEKGGGVKIIISCTGESTIINLVVT